MEENIAGSAPVETAEQELSPEEIQAIPVAPLEEELATLQAQYEALEAEKARIAAEKENYRRGMLKAKGKSYEDDNQDLPEEDKLRSIVREELLNTQELKNAKQNEDLVKSLLKKTQEMATALKNRTQMTPSGGSSAGESAPSKDHFWSAQQLADLKARNLDPDKVKQNVLKNRERAGV